MNKKTKRYSPPPLNTIDSKITDNFSKWSKVLQLISPPNKKRRSVLLNLIDDKQVVTEKQIIQKKLNRCGMYIPPNSINDGPKNAMHQWSLYKCTYQKLRQPLPLSESIHLRKMLILLQPQKQEEEEDDDVPLGTLLEKNKLAPTSHPISTNQFSRSNTTIYHTTVPSSYFQPQPYFYYNRIVQFI